MNTETPRAQQWLRGMNWYQSMGAAVVGGRTVERSHTVSSGRLLDSSGATLMSGTIVEADNYVTCLQTCGRQSDSCRWQRIPSGGGRDSLIYGLEQVLGRNVTWSKGPGHWRGFGVKSAQGDRL
jgi:hypothetical protein